MDENCKGQVGWPILVYLLQVDRVACYSNSFGVHAHRDHLMKRPEIGLDTAPRTWMGFGGRTTHGLTCVFLIMRRKLWT
jgi:hypothetical protein